jgi:hypothetical protein
MLSICPGGLTQEVLAATYSSVPVKLNTEGFVHQKKGQLFYNRLQNIDLTSNLYDSANMSSYSIPSSDIDNTATVPERNVVHKTPAGSIDVVKLLPTANLDSYVGMTIDHPAYIDYKSTGNATEIDATFDRVKQFTSLFREATKQTLIGADKIYGFETNDRFLVGQNSVGAALNVSVNDFASFQVNGVDSSASKEIYSGAQDSIMIPIIFQYRMTDALGNVNGQQSLTASSNFEYAKTIGFDLFINNKLFSFDVEVYAKYRPSSTANQRLNVVPSANNTRTKIS